MRKMIFLLSLFSFIPFNAMAKLPFCGTYAGINIGFSQLQVKEEYATDVLVPNTFDIYFLSHNHPVKVANNSFMGGIKLGTGLVFKHFFIGLEDKATFNDNDLIFDAQLNVPSGDIFYTAESQVVLNRTFAVLAKLGFIYDDNTLWYALIGPRFGHFEISSAVFFDLPSAGATSREYDRVGQTKCKMNWGLGLERLLSNQLSLALEYNYTYYGKLNFPSSVASPVFMNGSLVPGAQVTARDMFHAKTNTVDLQLNYYFA